MGYQIGSRWSLRIDSNFTVTKISEYMELALALALKHENCFRELRFSASNSRYIRTGRENNTIYGICL